MKKLFLLFIPFLFFLPGGAQVNTTEKELAVKLVKNYSKVIGLSEIDLADMIISSTYQNTADGIRMVYLQQGYRGLPVFNQMIVLAFKNDKLVSNAGGFISNLRGRTNFQANTPATGPADAVRAAIIEAKLSLPASIIPVEILENGRKIDFGLLNIASEHVTAELMWVPVMGKEGMVRLGWQVQLVPLRSSDYWNIRVDAINNKVIDKNNLTVYDRWDNAQSVVQPADKMLQTNSERDQSSSLAPEPNSPSLVGTANYLVIPYPVESPSHGAAALRTNPWSLAGGGNAVSLGWHNNGTTDYTTSRGNNVHAHEDRLNNNSNAGTMAVSSTSPDPLNFNFPPNYALAPTTASFQQFAITNLFYWNNIIHDITYNYGFNEAAGNFQASNQGRGGLGNDYVQADAQDGGGFNNANFSTPADGTSGRMQMYLFNGTTPNIDGDLDNGVIVHEYGHGISNRLTGGPANSSCLNNAEQGGEGWSDFLGLMLTTNWATAQVTDGPLAKPIGTYVLNQAPTGTGIRQHPYSTNMAIDPWTYADLAGTGGEVHDIGEIWCTALWEMTWELIAMEGINTDLFNAGGLGGNSAALKLVIEGMRLQPCSPGYIDARNAILKADTIFFAAKYSCAIWKAFAKRGMGKNATQGSSNNTTDQVADFTANGGLSLTLTQNVIQQEEGLNIIYTNHLSAGTCGALMNYTLRDTLPANVTYVSGGTYNAGTRVVIFPVNLAIGASQDYTFTVQINPGSYFAPVTFIDEQVTGPVGVIPAFWTATSTTSSVWTTHSIRSKSAPNSFFTPNRTTTSDQRLATTNSVALGVNPPVLSFWHWYNTEASWDGGVVEISTNGGTTWTDLGANMTSGGYNGSLGSSPNPLTGRSAFTGNSGAFVKTVVDLSSYANQNARFRFRMGSDGSLAVTGWNVDDILLRSTAVVNMRTSLFDNNDIRVSYSDTVTIILPATCASTINSSSAVGTDAQIICINTPISSITYDVAGGGTGAGVTGLPAGVTGAFNAGVFTISGTPTAAGVFNYSVTTTGACTPATATGSISVTMQTISRTSAVGTDAQTPCINTAITNITYAVGGTATGAGFVGLPAGLSGAFSAGVFTISGTPTASGTFNYTVTTTGTCNVVSANGSVTVAPASVGGSVPSVSICSGASGNVTLAGHVGSVLRWETSTDGGLTWSNIANTTNTQAYAGLTQAVLFKTLVQSGSCAATAYSNTAKVGIHNLWTGATSSDWSTGTNWSDDQSPTFSCPDVVIPLLAGPNVYPQLTSGTATVNNLVIKTGAMMLVTGATLQVAGSITNNGILTAGNGTIELNGTAATQTIAGSIFSGNSINNLIISNSNGVSFTGINDTVKIKGLLSFGANNAVLNTNNNLTLVSNAAGTASVGDLTGGGLYSGNNITGNATVERYIPLHPKAWQFLAVPTTGQSINAAWQEGNAPLSNALNPGYGTIITSNVAGAVGLGFDIYTPSGPTMKTYNPATNGWVGVAGTSMQIANPKGYMFFVRGDRSVTVFNQAATATTLRTTGQLFTVGANAPPSTTVLPGKFESVGNPYASKINFTLLTKPASIDNKFYVWDPLLTSNSNGLGGYQTISSVTGWKPTPGGTSNYDANTAYTGIQSGQAFFVYSTSGGGTLSFTEQAKVAGHETVNREANLAGDRQFLKLSLYNGNTAAAALSDGNVVAFDPAFSNGLDADDALKLTNTSENMGIRRAGKTMALEARAPVIESDTIFYSFSNLRRQTYQLRFSPENMDSELTALLVDKFMNTTTVVSLTGNSAVDFTITTDPLSSAAGRFYLIFNRVIPAVITQIAGTHTNRTTIKVDWVVAHESGIAHYDIQKSANGIEFNAINSIEAGSNNNSTASYSYTDAAAGTGINYYRIKGLKLNGQLIYSAIVKVLPQKTGVDPLGSFVVNENFRTVKPSVSIYPNPVVGHIVNLEFMNQPAGDYQVELSGKLGQVLYRNLLQVSSKTRVQQLHLGENVLPGNYQLKIISKAGEITVKELIIESY